MIESVFKEDEKVNGLFERKQTWAAILMESPAACGCRHTETESQIINRSVVARRV